MRLIIRPDYETMCRWAANYIVGRIKEFNPTPARPFVIGLPTGSSPLSVYAELVALYKAGKVSFANVVSFNMDEYIGLGADHPQSYHRFMWDNLFSKIDIKKENVHIPDGMARDPAAECEAYEHKIAAYGGIELFLGGVGADGHLAFNEPGSSLSSRTRVKTLTMDTRIANSRFFGGNIEAVPQTALTVGVGTVTDAHEVLMIVSGHGKARALQAAVEGGVNHMWTVSCLQLHRYATFVCDDAATDELKVATVRYFNAIEKDNFDNEV